MRDVRAWGLWRKIYQLKEACRIMRRLTPKQTHYFFKYMLDESKLVRDAKIKRFLTVQVPLIRRDAEAGSLIHFVLHFRRSLRNALAVQIKRCVDSSFARQCDTMNAKQGIECGEIEVKRDGIMAILVTGGRLTLASCKRLEMFLDCKASDAVILLEAEPYFDDGVAADVKIKIVNLQSADVAQVAILEELRAETARQDAKRDEILERGSR